MKKNYSKPEIEVYTTELIHCICVSGPGGTVPDAGSGGEDDILDDALLNPFKGPFERILF